MTDPSVDRLASALGDRYAIERELGAGGMAVVYLARDLRHDRPVALKVLRPELAAAVGHERFLKEIRLTANLQHPHILPLYDSGEAAGQLYYVMPFVEGESLRARLSGGTPLSIGEVVRVLGDVAQALQHAHQRGVVHRDIKPDNVMLSGDTAVVADFGIAKAVAASRATSGDAPLTHAGLPLGTPAYMAPEQVAEDPDIDHRADIYAFGCMAYELLVGRVPFEGRSPQGVLTGHLIETPRPLSELRPDTPPALGQLVMRCLEKEPAARPQHAAELVAALEGISSTSAMPALPPVLLGGPAAFRRALILYVVAVVVVAIAAKVADSAIGLPDWVFPGALLVMALGLPVLLFTGYVQYATRRALSAPPAHTTGGNVVPPSPFAKLALKAGSRLSWKRAARGGLYALGAFVLLTAGFMGMRAWGIGPPGTLIAKGKLKPRPLLLITDFAVKSADSALAGVVAEGVRVNLAQSKAITLFSPGAVPNALQRMRRPRDSRVDLALARQIAEREGVAAIVDGEVTGLGAGFVVTLRLVSADSGNVLTSFQETADRPEQLIPAVDAVARKLRSRIGESLKDVQASPPLARSTTASLEALRLYTQAVRIPPGLAEVGLLRGAVAIDSNFAMAWRALAVVLVNSGFPQSSVDSALTKAYELRDRLPDRERYRVDPVLRSGTGIRPAEADRGWGGVPPGW